MRKLPVGKVEAVLLVDPKVRPEQNQRWRFTFDYDRFRREDDGKERSENGIVARVGHVIRTLGTIVEDMVSKKLWPVYARKEEDDTIVVGLWKCDRNPASMRVTVKGWTVGLFEIPWGSQCELGFDDDPRMRQVQDIAAFVR
jgi:hypothetical protein